jgi:hypothetical protein
MKKILGAAIALGLAATPALAQKITIDYAHDYDFEKVKTFAYQATKETDSKDELMDGRIKSAIIGELEEGGLQLVESDPDIYVTYHISTKDNTVYNTTSFGYGGYGGGWGGWGGGMGTGSSTTTATTYIEGTLVLDGYDAGDKKMIWRGTGTVTLKQKPEKQAVQIQKIMTKMGARWDKMLKNQGK